MNTPRSSRGPDARNVEATENTTTVENVTGQSADLVSHPTQLSEADAVAITADIRSDLRAAEAKIGAAYRGRVWVSLGYENWNAYADAEFGGSIVKVPLEQRRELVVALRDEGLSLRSIAAVTGQGRGTVQRDLAAGVPSGTAGAASSASAPRPASEFTTFITEIAVTASRQAGTAPRVVGRDGKSYPARAAKLTPTDVLDAEIVEDPPSPRTPRRKPLPDAYRDAVHELRKAVERVERLRDDDRYPTLREARPDLDRQVDELAAALVGGAR